MNAFKKGFKTLRFNLFNFQQSLLLECLLLIENVFIFLIFSIIRIIREITFLVLLVDKNQCVILSKSDKGDGDEKDEEEEERESKEQIEN